MRILGGLMLMWLAGMFAGGVVLTWIIMFDLGYERIGFPEYTLYYYIISLGICVLILAMSKLARLQWKLMGLYGAAVLSVAALGWPGGSIDALPSDGQIERLRADVEAMAIGFAKVMMYATPGGLVLLYSYLAYLGLNNSQSLKQVNDIDYTRIE